MLPLSTVPKCPVRPPGRAITSTKINSDLSAVQKKLDEAYNLAGQRIYESYKLGDYKADDLLKPVLSEIDEINAKIIELKKELAKAKDMLVCEACGEIIDRETKFCPYCGAESKE